MATAQKTPRKYKHNLTVAVQKSEILAGVKHGCTEEESQHSAAIYEAHQAFRANPEKYGFSGLYDTRECRYDWGDFDVVVISAAPREHYVDLQISVSGRVFAPVVQG